MEGERISVKELKARWAYSEIWEVRWRGYYAELSPEKVRRGVPFDNLNLDERAHLQWMLSMVRYYISPELDKFQTYECQSWTKDQLGRAYTMLCMSPNG